MKVIVHLILLDRHIDVYVCMLIHRQRMLVINEGGCSGRVITPALSVSSCTPWALFAACKMLIWSRGSLGARISAAEMFHKAAVLPSTGLFSLS